MLCALGDVVEDVTVRLAGPPAHGADADARIDRHRGGSAANVAAVAASLAGVARFVGQVGADGLGDRLVAALVAERVDPRVVRGGRSGTIVVLVDQGGERTMLRDRGSTADLASFDPAWLGDVAALHVPAYGLYEGAIAATAREAVAAAHELGVLVSIDVSSSTLLERFGVARFRRLLAELRPDVLHANEVEADVLGLDAARPAADVGIQVITRGAAASEVASADGYVTAVPDKVAPVDSTGAGDAFMAGFLVTLIEGGEPADALRGGHAAATRTVTTPGAGAPL